MREIVTERLRLRLLQADDVPAFAAYRSDPDVARYQSWDSSYTTADGERLVAAQRGVDFGDPGPWVQVAGGAVAMTLRLGWGLEHMSTDTFCSRRPSCVARPKAARS